MTCNATESHKVERVRTKRSHVDEHAHAKVQVAALQGRAEDRQQLVDCERQHVDLRRGESREVFTWFSQ